MVIPATELAQIQADLVDAACDKACEIWRGVATKDAYGNASIPDSSYTLLDTTVAGMTEPTAGQLQNYEFRIGSLAAWQVKLPYSASVQVDDWLIIEGQKLYVHVDLNPHSIPGLRTVLAAEMK